jgi:predicted nucleotidyltransferase
VKTSSLKENILKDLLIKTTHQKVISLFLINPTHHFYGSEISKKTGISIGQTSKILNDLLKAGLVEKERKGKTEIYHLIGDSPLLRIYKILNTLIFISPLVEKLKKVSKKIILFGSCAKGINMEDSDLDLFIISNNRERVLRIISQYAYNKYSGFSEIKPVVKKTAEWAILDEIDPVFYNELQKGILLYEKEVDESRL